MTTTKMNFLPAMATAFLLLGTATKAQDDLEIVQDYGYDYAWPTEEGWFISPSYEDGNYWDSVREYTYGSLRRCARRCQQRGAPGGIFGAFGDWDMCLCQRTLECLEPTIIVRGGTVFSIIPQPEQCPASFCDTWADTQESYCTDDNVERRTPTATPTFSPSSSPTKAPTTKAPTTKGPTTALPTRNPTAWPTKSPTDRPTNRPSVTPTKQPSPAPSNSPSFSPSTHPSLSPSSIPSIYPTSSPSAAPSISPSSSPSTSPSTAPSASPSSLPSTAPSTAPSTSPSTTPSSLPSSMPSSSPSSMPSTAPSSSPSTTPSSSPSSTPSSSPSSMPSSSPTTLPRDVSKFAMEILVDVPDDDEFLKTTASLNLLTRREEESLTQYAEKFLEDHLYDLLDPKDVHVTLQMTDETSDRFLRSAASSTSRQENTRRLMQVELTRNFEGHVTFSQLPENLENNTDGEADLDNITKSAFLGPEFLDYVIEMEEQSSSSAGVLKYAKSMNVTLESDMIDYSRLIGQDDLPPPSPARKKPGVIATAILVPAFVVACAMGYIVSRRRKKASISPIRKVSSMLDQRDSDSGTEGSDAVSVVVNLQEQEGIQTAKVEQPDVENKGERSIHLSEPAPKEPSNVAETGVTIEKHVPAQVIEENVGAAMNIPEPVVLSSGDQREMVAETIVPNHVSFQSKQASDNGTETVSIVTFSQASGVVGVVPDQGTLNSADSGESGAESNAPENSTVDTGDSRGIGSEAEVMGNSTFETWYSRESIEPRAAVNQMQEKNSFFHKMFMCFAPPMPREGFADDSIFTNDSFPDGSLMEASYPESVSYQDENTVEDVQPYTSYDDTLDDDPTVASVIDYGCGTTNELHRLILYEKWSSVQRKLQDLQELGSNDKERKDKFNFEQMIRGVDEQGRTPLSLACGSSAPPEIIESFLIASPLCANIQDKHKNLAIHHFCHSYKGQKHAVQVLKWLHEYCPIGAKTRNGYGNMPLHVYIEHQCGSQMTKETLDIFQQLLEMNQNAVFVSNIEGSFAMHHIGKPPSRISVGQNKKKQGSSESVRTLFSILHEENPQAIRIQNKFGATPFFYVMTSNMDIGVWEDMLTVYPEAAKIELVNGATPISVYWNTFVSVKAKRKYLKLSEQEAEKERKQIEKHRKEMKEIKSAKDLTRNGSSELKDFWKKMELMLRSARYDTVSSVLPSGQDWRVVHAICSIDDCPSDLLKFALHMYGHQAEEVDEEGNFPLHIAAGAGTGVLTARQSENIHSMIKVVLSRGAYAFNRAKQLPLHIAIQSGKTWSKGVESLVNAYPEAIRIRDPNSGLHPFMMAAVASSEVTNSSSPFLRKKQVERAEMIETARARDHDAVTTIYRLLRANPSAIAPSRTNNVSSKS